MNSASVNSVLDASALLAYLKGEPGAQHVAAALAAICALSAANWAETLSKLAEQGQDPDQVATYLAQQGILGVGLRVPPLDENQAREIARLRTQPRSTGPSLGDRACLALAKALGLPALTTGRSWATLNLGMTVQVVR